MKQLRPLLKTAEVAAILGVGRDFVLRRCRQLGGVRIGKRDLRFEPEAVEAWIVAHRVRGDWTARVGPSVPPASRRAFTQQLKDRVFGRV